MDELLKKLLDYTSTDLVGGIISLLLGVVTSWFYSQLAYKKFFKRKETTPKTYSEQLSELTSNLTKSTAEVDKILAELSSVSTNRQEALSKLEVDLAMLEKRENETKKRIEELQKVPLVVADYFAELTKEGEKRSAKRDYLLFGAGVVVSTIVAILLKILGWA